MQQLEIERKWLVDGWPDLPPVLVCEMWQGYISHAPTVRIRKTVSAAGTSRVLCLKSAGTIARTEVEIEIDAATFDALLGFTCGDLIYKRHRRYALADGLVLEVSEVDPGRETSFFYAEVEFPSMAAAERWQPDETLRDYLSDEVSGVPGYSMGAYWRRTREKPAGN